MNYSRKHQISINQKIVVDRVGNFVGKRWLWNEDSATYWGVTKTNKEKNRKRPRIRDHRIKVYDT